MAMMKAEVTEKSIFSILSKTNSSSKNWIATTANELSKVFHNPLCQCMRPYGHADDETNIICINGVYYHMPYVKLNYFVAANVTGCPFGDV